MNVGERKGEREREAYLLMFVNDNNWTDCVHNKWLSPRCVPMSAPKGDNVDY